MLPLINQRRLSLRKSSYAARCSSYPEAAQLTMWARRVKSFQFPAPCKSVTNYGPLTEPKIYVVESGLTQISTSNGDISETKKGCG